MKYIQIYKDYARWQEKRTDTAFQLKLHFDNMPHISILRIFNYGLLHDRVIMLFSPEFYSSKGGKIVKISSNYFLIKKVSF